MFPPMLIIYTYRSIIQKCKVFILLIVVHYYDYLPILHLGNNMWYEGMLLFSTTTIYDIIVITCTCRGVLYMYSVLLLYMYTRNIASGLFSFSISEMKINDDEVLLLRFCWWIWWKNSTPVVTCSIAIKIARANSITELERFWQRATRHLVVSMFIIFVEFL